MYPVDPFTPTKQYTTPTYAQIVSIQQWMNCNDDDEQQINDSNAIPYNYTHTQPAITNAMLIQHEQQIEHMEQMQYNESNESNEQDENRLLTSNLDLGTFHTPTKTRKKPNKIQVKNTPSRWKKYYCSPPSTPDSTDDGYNSNEINMFAIIEEKTNTSVETSETIITDTDTSFDLWMNKIKIVNKNNNTTKKEYEYYNKITGGKCYEIEQECKKFCVIDNVNKIYLSYLNNINKNNIFYLNDESIYENIFIYLDGKSIFNGVMITCKKLYYFKFMDQTIIWNNLLKRDFPKLYNNYYDIEIPYSNTYASFTNTILLRPNERKLYWTKIKNDKFWGLLFYLKFKNINLNSINNEEIENTWKNIEWKELLFGNNNDCGLFAYKQLIKLRNHSYIQSFNNDKLPTKKIIEKFCNAIRKHMPTGNSILYLSPYLNPTRCIEWVKHKVLWLHEYDKCWALSEYDKYFYDEIHKLPPIIMLLGQIQFQNGKSFKPDSNTDWLDFLKTFDPTINKYNQIKNGWFQKQFLLNEMENRLKNIRNLIEIVRP